MYKTHTVEITRQREQRTSAPRISFMQIMRLFLKVGVIGFGGGSALIPVIEREVVRDNAYLSKEEYLHHTVVANITPGALPIKLGATCGQRLGGIAGSLAGAYAVMLPGTLVTVALMALFGLLGEGALRYFHHASVGITAFIVFLLAGYVMKVLRQGNRAVNLTLCAAAFAVTGGKELRELLHLVFGLETGAPILDISTIHLMLATILLILVQAAVGSGMHRSPRRPGMRIRLPGKTLLLILCFLLPPTVLTALTALAAGDAGILSFVGRIAISTITSFGGGESYVSVADGMFVQSGIITPEMFYSRLVPVANALPGPILVKIAAGTGYLYGTRDGSALLGWGHAAAAATAAVAACCSVAVVVFELYGMLRESALVAGLRRYMLPVISGMLASTSCAMLAESIRVTEESEVPGGVGLLVSVGWVALLFVITRKRHINDLLLLLGSAGSSLLWLTFI